ncbi:MAG: GPP34 family phosphoprotein [Planctomycetota bacterium]|jgi:hypothetical protein|nr:GPP34 family phosphoprotein [Planctomycetota bacterium]
MLTFAEELLLLALDDEEGVVRSLPQVSLDTAIAAALLEELSFLRKIDATPTMIYVAEPSRMRFDDLLDEVLKLLIAEDYQRPIVYWLNEIVERIPRLTDRVLNGLVEKKILKRENRKIWWVFEEPCYPVADNEEILAVKTRLRRIIESDEIPMPRDATIISLARACRLFLAVFTPEERRRYAPRLDQIAKFSMVGQALSKSLRDFEQTICLINETVYKYN